MDVLVPEVVSRMYIADRSVDYDYGKIAINNNCVKSFLLIKAEKAMKSKNPLMVRTFVLTRPGHSEQSGGWSIIRELPM